MASKIRHWINERLSFDVMLQSALDEDIPGGSSFFYTLGSATLFVFGLQVITGVWQLFYYVPTIDHAYASLSYLRLSVPYGWLIQGIHYWGANLMAVLIGLHMLRVFIWGAHKKPRELTWLLGVLLLLIVVGLIFTGAALPWDQRGYWAAEVGTSIAGTVPFIGKGIIYLIRGGESMSQLTLSRLFVLHTAILPGLAFLIVAFHLMAFRQHGSVGPWKEAKRQKKGNFWPDQIAKDLLISALILLLLVGLSAYAPAPFTGPADTLNSLYHPKPEWNFLFLYQILKLFTGSTELIGTVGVPTLIILILVLVPFIDRKKERSPLKRPGMMVGGFIFIIIILIFTIIGYYSKPPESSKGPKKIVKSEKVIKLSPSAIKGSALFKTYACLSCHKISGEGGTIGPDLTNEYKKGRSRKWIITQIINSKKNYPNSIMPPFTMLSSKQLNNLVDFILSPHAQTTSASANTSAPLPTPSSNKTNKSSNRHPQNKNISSAIVETTKSAKSLGLPGKAAWIIGNVAEGNVLYKANCESCHGINGEGGVPNPGSFLGKVPPLNPISSRLFNKNPQKFANNIDRYIQHGSIPVGPNPALKMSDYGDTHSFTQPEIANLEAYILNLNGINRAKIVAPGSTPKQFFKLSLWIFLGIIVILIILGIFVEKKKKNQKE